MALVPLFSPLSCANVVMPTTNNTATITFFIIIVLVPIILFYFLKDWPKMIETVQSILPLNEKNKIREIFSEFNVLLSAYIRGQLNICLILSIYYLIGLNLINIDLALLLGIIAGFIVVVPFVGALISLFLMLVSCYFSYGASIEMIYVLILFIIGKYYECWRRIFALLEK